MGILRENSIALHEQRETQAKVQQSIIEQALKEKEDLYISRESIREAAQKRVDNYYKYKYDVKMTLVTRAIRNLCIESMTNPSDYDLAVI